MTFKSRPSIFKTRYKVKIKGEKPIDLAHIDAARLEVWEYLSDSEELLNADPDNLRPLLDLSNKNTIKRVCPHHKVSSFIHTESGVITLLVRVLGVSHASALNLVTVSSGSSQQPGGYTDIFIQVSEPSKFNDIDLRANRVVRTDNNFVPSFVVDYWTKLEEKRSVNVTLGYLRGTFGDRLTFENFKSASMQESPQQPPSFEIRHMLDMGFIKEKAWSDGHKETFANGLLFFRLQSYLNLSSQLES
ncbi:hypothetical protein EDB92DRAFT_2101601 [Lactarius akahatsu]|uniref:Uncharacterized protein n=2 Tax=Lactarius akahatsu TaxID=416441 RepID=A0AAD4LRE3_9AGAM|nr:hypothetical protein EDB92DRAFT_2101601 [Lactarius akahatsu]